MKPLEVVSRELRKTVQEALHKLGGHAKNISQDKLLIYINIYMTLKSLGAPIDEIYNALLDSIGIGMERVAGEGSEQVYRYPSTMRILRRISGRKRINVSEIISQRSTATDLLDYIWLRKENYLVKTRKRRLAINSEIYREEIEESVERIISFNDITKYLIELPSRLWSKILTPEFLRRLSNNQLAQLIDKYYGYNGIIDRRLIDELAERISRNPDRALPTIYTNNRVMKELTRRTGYINPYCLTYMQDSELSRVNIEKIKSDLYEISLHERQKILSRNINKKIIRRLLGQMDIYTLSSINAKINDEYIKQKIMLGKALSEAIHYMITGSPARLDYSQYLLSRIDPQRLDPELHPIYESLVTGDYNALIQNISRRSPELFIEYLAGIVSRIHRERGGISREEVEKAIKIGYAVMRSAMRRMGEPIGKHRWSQIEGRPDIRKSIYSYMHYNYEIWRRTKNRIRRVHLLIDTSGSMLKYSTWAILSTAYLIPSTKYIVLFSSDTKIFRSSKKTIKHLLIEFLEEIYINGFTGYTNVSRAFRALERIAGPGEKAVVISDLIQTVDDEDPVDVAERITRKQITLSVITPLRHDVRVADGLRKMGQYVYVDPRLTRRFLGKLLG